MKTMKRLAALILALSLLLGIPMSVSAIGTATPSDLKLIGAQVIPLGKLAPDDKVHVDADWKDRGILMYFNQNLAGKGLKDSENVKGRLLVVDENNEIVAIEDSGTQTYLFWNIDGYPQKSSATPVSPGSGKIVAHAGRVWAKTLTFNGVDYESTWTDIIKLLGTHEKLAGKGYRLQVRLYDIVKNNDGVLAQVQSANDANVKLSATGNDPTGAGVGSAYQGRDYAAIDLGTVAAGATEITQTGMLTLDRVKMVSETHMELTYSESVEARMSDGVSVQVQVVQPDGTLCKLPGTETDAIFKATGHSATSVSLSESKKWSDIQKVLDENPGSYARLRIQEKNPANARDEWANNYAVDTIWGKNSLKPLQSDLKRNPGTVDGEARDFVFCKIEPFRFDLLSVKQIGLYQVELKFSDNLRTEIHAGSGLPWILYQINTNKMAKLGIAWVKDGYTGQEVFSEVTSDAVEGTVAIGETEDTLIWTVTDQVPANFISTLLKETKEGYTRKFYVADNNNCTWSDPGYIGAVQAAKTSAGVEKPLSVPASNKKEDDKGREFLFMDIMPDPNPAFELVSVTEIGDYQLELQFSEDLRTETHTDSGLAWILYQTNNEKMAKLGIAWVKDGYTGQEDFSEVTADVVEGTIAIGKTNDTLIWTATDRSKIISDLLDDEKEGYTRKFYVADNNGCDWLDPGYIGAVQAVPNDDVEKALSIPASNKKEENKGQEFLFMDIIGAPIIAESATAISDTEVIIKFSHPVEIGYAPFFCLRFMDQNMKLAKDAKGAPLQYYGTWEFTDDTHDTIKWTSNQWNVRNIVSMSGSWAKYKELGYKPYFCIEELQDKEGKEIDVKGNGFIDNIVKADGRMLVANLKASGENYDGLYLTVIEDYKEPDFYLKKVTAINKQQLVLEFNKPVQIDDLKPYMAIRYVNELNVVQYDADKKPLQYAGTYEYGNKEKTVLIWTQNFGGNIEAVINQTGDYSEYTKYKVMFCIEEIPVDKKAGDTEDGTIHNVYTDGGIKLYANTVGNGTGWDGVYMPITIDHAYKIPGTVIASAIKADKETNKKSQADETDEITPPSNENQVLPAATGPLSDKLFMAKHTDFKSMLPWIALGVASVAVVSVIVVLVAVIAKKKDEQ